MVPPGFLFLWEANFYQIAGIAKAATLLPAASDSGTRHSDKGRAIYARLDFASFMLNHCAISGEVMRFRRLPAIPALTTFRGACALSAGARALAVAMLAVSLVGCGALDLVSTHAGDYKQFDVRDARNVNSFLISDETEAQKIKVKMNTGARASALMNDIFTFGLSYTDATEATMRSAAVDYLKSTKRNCTVAGGKEIGRMSWEFQYHCEAAAEQNGKKS